MQESLRSNSSNQKKVMHQSNFELLRIIAMLMIVLCHFFFYNKFSLDQQPMRPKRIVLKTFLASQGRVGLDIFFAISIWFLCKPNHQIHFHDSARRAWVLERTLLFWSLVLTIVCFATRILPVTARSILNAIFPTATCDWGYATSYIFILLLLPSINQGISRLSQRQHLCMCVVLLVFGPVFGVIPGFNHQMAASGPSRSSALSYLSPTFGGITSNSPVSSSVWPASQLVMRS